MDKKITCNEGTVWTAKEIAGYIRENGRLIGRTSRINTERSQREVEMIKEYAENYHQSQLQALKEVDIEKIAEQEALGVTAEDNFIHGAEYILDLITSLEDNG